MTTDSARPSGRWPARLFLAAFFLELLNLFSLAISHGGLQLFPVSADRFESFRAHALLAALFLAAREASRWRRTSGEENRYRASRLAVVAVCLAGVSIYFEHGVRLGADGPNYFIQARSLLFDRDIDFGNELERVAGVVPGMPERATGLPLVSMPFLALAHLLLKIGRLRGLHLTADGFGYPYETAFGLASYLVGALGLVAMLRAAFRFFSPSIALASVLTVGASSFLAWYMVVEPAMPHAVSAASLAFVVCFWLERRPLAEDRDWMALGLLLGFAALARWQNVLFIALPFVDALMKPRRPPLQPAWSLAGFALAFTPQLGYWYAMAGSPFAVSLERHAVEWTQLTVGEVLFSTNRGLFPWSPVLYLGFLGVLVWLKRSPRLASLCLLGFALQVFVNSSVEMWYGGWAYGGRRFDNCLVLFVLGFAAFLELLRRRPLVPVALLSALLVSWNVGTMLQMKRADLAPDGTVSFKEVAESNLALFYDRLGFPPAWPANWLFAWRHRVPAEKFDRLFGHSGFGNFRLPMDADAEGFLGRGWGAPERDDRNEWFRWTTGDEATVLVPLREPHFYHLSIWIRPYEAIGKNRIGLRINGHVKRSFEIDKDAFVKWELEPELFREGINELRFDFQKSLRPSDVAPSADSRDLAVRFYRLELVAQQATAERPLPIPGEDGGVKIQTVAPLSYPSLSWSPPD
jgi:hypothetical protein